MGVDTQLPVSSDLQHTCPGRIAGNAQVTVACDKSALSLAVLLTWFTPLPRHTQVSKD